MKKKKTTYEKDCFTDPRSFIEFDKKENGKLRVNGTAYFYGVAFPFKLTQQASGPNVMRGYVTVRSPKDGKILQVAGQKKSAIIKNIAEKRPEYLQKNEGKRIPELNINTAISLIRFSTSSAETAALNFYIGLCRFSRLFNNLIGIGSIYISYRTI